MTRKALRFTAGTLMVALVAFAGIQIAQAQTIDFNVPAQSATTGIPEFARQAGIQILVSEPLVRGKRIATVTGSHSVEEALAILLKGTGLVATSRDGATYTVATSQAPSSLRNSTAQANALAASQSPSKNPQNATVPVSESKETEKPKLEEIVVTGSRLRVTATQGSQDVQVYTREQIDQSGQTAVSDFLNTLPGVAQMSSEAPGGTSWSSSVQLHGLPVGTTLVLVNGRRVGISAFQEVFNQENFVDLNSIPLAIVERIEVVSAGSSAVYGSDAIGGVVNIILKKSFEGFDIALKYGGASGTDDLNSSLAWGKHWESASITMIGSFQDRSELTGFDRALTANQDFTPYGGPDARTYNCNPGNVYSVVGNNLPGVGAPYAAVPAGFTGTPSQSEFASTAGQLNKCSFTPYSSLIPSTRRAGLLVLGSYDLASSAELFTEILYSHVDEINYTGPNSLYGVPGYQSFTVSPSNPYNPFGETVGISNLLTSLGRVREPLETNFLRPLLGIRGELFNKWKWEVAGWTAHDNSTGAYQNVANSADIQSALNSSNPATALNPFIDGPLGSPQLLRSFLYTINNTYDARTNAADAFINGPLLTLPSGDVQAVIGAEYDRDDLSYNDTFNAPPTASFHRSRYAAFSEARIPLLGKHTNGVDADTLAVTLAARYDDYSDFGSKATPQYGAEWRPTATLLIRGTYGRAFKAPTLDQLYSPTNTYQSVVNDPLNGNQTEGVTISYGGNPRLKPETGQSRTLGLVYSSKLIPDFRVTVTYWSIDENDSIQELDYQTIADNPNLFPGAVIRAPTCSSGPCPITLINDGFVNYGAISVRGFDYRLDYDIDTAVGVLAPSASVTQTYHYTAALTPDVAPTDRASIANDDGNWAPRWKGTVALNWKSGPYAASTDGRYVSHYQDYDPLPNGTALTLGNFWLCDVSFRYAIGSVLTPTNAFLKGSEFQVGAVNVFNTLPQFSNHFGGFNGFDPSEGDIRGRFAYLQLHTTF
jgi:iron complex outermembrane receptor protein